MKYNRPIYALLCALCLLCGCSQSDAVIDPIPQEEYFPSEAEPSDSDTTYNSNIQIVVEDDTQPPREGLERSPLTNEWIPSAAAASRPIAVMIPNEINAIPHYNLSKASVVYEAKVEGSITRLMAIYDDWTSLKRIGNIRSTRTYYAYWAFEWDAFLVHYGGPYYIHDLMNEETTENIDGLDGDGGAFYRSKDRTEPHNLYTDGTQILTRIKSHKYATEYRDPDRAPHFVFASKAEPNTLRQYGDNAYNATYIDLSGCYPLTRCYFEFNEDDGLYYRYQHLSGGTDMPHTDADGTQLAFKNILVQYTKHEVLDDKGYLVLQCHDDSRDGWFFTNGKSIHVNWQKTGDYEATRYYDDDGNEITVNTGKTMICIVDEHDSFTFR
ncbi:MAG: DUF3048 domain-containing protein [Lachnospiraceae bacterium]|nr:DUF3048 domain-containing protein [Lachnospiraceae bacterium]